ncbi:MAG: hypothetical protein OXU63_08320 [Acidobacteriota bacterium]|nr:hypothetical protein [Acidobacteriota bacterium]
MPTDAVATFPGIHNENEFYSQHYLSEIFAKDIGDTVSRWSDEAKAAGGASADARPPYDALRGLAGDYLRFRGHFARERRGHEARVEDQRAWFRQLLAALGYEYKARNHVLDDGDEVPVLHAARQHGAVNLLVLGAYDAVGEDEDPLTLKPHRAQYHGEAPPPEALLKETWSDIVTRRIFGQQHPPRWVVLLSASQILLIERGKWTHNRLLRFDLDEMLGRRDGDTLKAAAALLHRECLVPEQGGSLLDSLDENSHKHAFAVSEDLKYALRESIELIGNEAIRYLREVSRDRVFDLDDQLAGELGLECLRYMYRLLFLFYIEARPDLGYAPIDAEAYRKGYSLERLRDLELVRLTTEESLDGYYLHHSVQVLFRLVRDGFGDEGSQFVLGGRRSHGFRMRALDSRLFRDDATPLLDRVKLRNRVLQKVLRLMSLSRPAKGRRGRRGRISYARLGINQLGAVYEALLSYRGFFAEEDLYEVKKAGDTPDVLASAWFVPARDLGEYEDDERVYDKDEQGRRKLRVHPRGSFVYRLAGRDRQKTASYYTPESLTECVVKHSLKELITDDMPADRILELTVCEPAMGSAAFLNEAVNQLAEKYLDRKQAELGRRIPHDEYADELQKVRHYIADRNVYGVDLNPVALELAEVSLWLNCIHGDGHVPWFGYQLLCGNSLVGARRQVFPSTRLGRQKRKADLWFNEPPERVEPLNDAPKNAPRRPSGAVYHFLVPDPGMANYRNKAAKELAPESFERIAKWRRGFVRPFDAEQTAELERLSDRVDELWALHTEQLARDHRETEDTLPVWGQPPAKRERRTANVWKDGIRAQGVLSESGRTASPYRRLKLVMDYWCALWFWPIEKADQLPDRDEFLNEISLVLTGSVYEPGIGPNQAADLFGEEYAEHADEIAKRIANEIGMLDLDKLFEQFPRLKFVDELASRHRFHHWELAFADIFYGHRADAEVRGGFDLVLGNPPWVRVKWEEGGVLGDFNPLLAVRRLSATEIASMRGGLLQGATGLRHVWLAELEQAEATQSFLNAGQNYPLLAGQKANLYKCFLPQAWMVAAAGGVTGFLHEEGVYDDPKGGPFREALYPRLRAHFQFLNEKRLFPEVDHHTSFSVNVCGRGRRLPRFAHIANLFAPTTVDACFEHDGRGPVPGIKDDENRWTTAGHRGRIVDVDQEALANFAKLYDEPGTPPIRARLPALHAGLLLGVLRKFASHPRRLGDLGDDVYVNSNWWNETMSQQDGFIRRTTCFPPRAGELVLSGPHYFVANPLNKTARRMCANNSDYDVLDLDWLPEGYLPRTNYVPACEPSEYRRRTPNVTWTEPGESAPRKTTDYCRFVSRRMASSSMERTLIGALVPKDVALVDTSVATTIRDSATCVEFAALASSVVFDFFVKSTGASDVRLAWLSRLPVLTEGFDAGLRHGLRSRMLRLCCLTHHYADLWSENCTGESTGARRRAVGTGATFGAESLPEADCAPAIAAFRKDAWAKQDPRLPQDFSQLSSEWRRDVALRTDYARRQALVEIDVLTAMALGLTLDELLTIYRVQFPVMRQYEADTWYDRNGRIVFTVSKGLPGVGLPRKARKGDTAYGLRTPDTDRDGIALGWEDIRELQEGVVTRRITDDTLPGGPVDRTIEYHAPFDRCDREADYATAWAAFHERLPPDRASSPVEKTGVVGG